MSFGTIFKTREDIVELLRSAYDAFADVLSKMQDKLEFGLKVLWDRDEIVRAIGDKMIMNAAFLVQRDQEPAFDRRIKEIASAFDKLTFKYTGPWPPYNFVNIRLKLERAGQH